MTTVSDDWSWPSGQSDWGSDEGSWAEGVTADSEAEASPEAGGSPSNRRVSLTNRTTLVVLASGLAVIAIIGFGFLAGWSVASRQSAPYSGPEIVEVPIPKYDPDAPASMPDVRGLPQSDAQAVLADAGIPASVVKLATREAAGAVGIVIDQTPAFGTENPAIVDLVVSSQAVVPNIVGKSEAEATNILVALGTRVDPSRRYKAGTAPGLVVEVNPVAGSPLGEAVAMVVSEEAGSIYLNQISRITGGCSSDQVRIDGRDYPESLACSAAAKPQLSEWLLNRAADELSGTLGVPDDGPADAAVRVRVLADGAEVGTFTSTYGTGTPFTVPMAGVLRLGIEVTAVNMPERSSSSWQASLGDARLSGSTAPLETLAKTK